MHTKSSERLSERFAKRFATGCATLDVAMCFAVVLCDLRAVCALRFAIGGHNETRARHLEEASALPFLVSRRARYSRVVCSCDGVVTGVVPSGIKRYQAVSSGIKRYQAVSSGIKRY